MKHRKVILILLVIVLHCMTIYAQNSQTGAAIALEPLSNFELMWNLKSEVDNLLPGDTAYIMLEFSGEMQLYAFEGELSYDTSKLKLKKVTFPEGGISKVLSSQDGRVEFVYSCLGDSTLNQTHPAAEFQFACLTAEDSVVTLQSSTTVDISLQSYQNNAFLLSADVKMKKPDPPKKPTGGGGGGGTGSFHGGISRPQPTPILSEPLPSEPMLDSKADENNPPVPLTEFTDLQGFAWAAEAISSLSSKNILTGIGGGKFEPSRAITRAEAAKLLTIMFSSENTSNEPLNFSDVETGAWYTEYIRNASAHGWIVGYEDGSFQPGAPLTREDFSVILMRIVQIQSLSADKGNKTFSDAGTISKYAVESVNALTVRGIIQGNEENRFEPQNPVSRAEAAKILYTVQNTSREENLE